MVTKFKTLEDFETRPKYISEGILSYPVKQVITSGNVEEVAGRGFILEFDNAQYVVDIGD